MDTLSWLTDSDFDTLDDDWESIIIDDNPADSLVELLDVKPGDDYDQDSLSNLYEFRTDTNPTTTDSDGDTLPDAWEANFFRIGVPILPPPPVWWKLNHEDAGLIVNTQGDNFNGSITGMPSFTEGLFIDNVNAVSTTDIFDDAISLFSDVVCEYCQY